MPYASLDGIDAAGGAISALGNSHVRSNGVLLLVIGDPVAPHGDPPHSSATMVTGSSVVKINGIGLVRAGDLASCGHAATGSSHVNAS